MLSQSEIRKRREELDDEVQALRGEVDVKIAEIRALQRRCKHPNKYQTSCMGESGMHCPDCGWGY